MSCIPLLLCVIPISLYASYRIFIKAKSFIELHFVTFRANNFASELFAWKLRQAKHLAGDNFKNAIHENFKDAIDNPRYATPKRISQYSGRAIALYLPRYFFGCPTGIFELSKPWGRVDGLQRPRKCDGGENKGNSTDTGFSALVSKLFIFDQRDTWIVDYRSRVQNLNDMLKYTVTVMKELKLENWWIAAGTLLGAYRNNRLLPWDTDADINILSDDFEILRQAIQSGLTYQIAEKHGFHGMDFVLQDSGESKSVTNGIVDGTDFRQLVGARLIDGYSGINVDFFVLDVGARGQVESDDFVLSKVRGDDLDKMFNQTRYVGISLMSRIGTGEYVFSSTSDKNSLKTVVVYSNPSKKEQNFYFNCNSNQFGSKSKPHWRSLSNVTTNLCHIEDAKNNKPTRYMNFHKDWIFPRRKCSLEGVGEDLEICPNLVEKVLAHLYGPNFKSPPYNRSDMAFWLAGMEILGYVFILILSVCFVWRKSKRRVEQTIDARTERTPVNPSTAQDAPNSCSCADKMRNAIGISYLVLFITRWLMLKYNYSDSVKTYTELL